MHLGLIGYGSIATSLIELLPDSRVRKLTVLLRPTSMPLKQIEGTGTSQSPLVEFVTELDEFLKSQPDLVVECAGHAAVPHYVPDLLQSGLDVIVASVGALADEQLYVRINAAAAQGRSRIILPSGAIGGLDILRAISQHGEVEVTYRGIKPAEAWTGTPAEEVLDLTALDGATTFFSGTGRQAALAFPKNANVVAALALAGADFDRMKVELIADPAAQSNQHTYSVVSPLCRYSMAIEATPSTGNARTSITTVLSISKEIADYQIAPQTD